MSTIVVIGAGYVGLASAVCFSHLGHEVIGAEIDADRLMQLNAGEPPFLERGMKDFLTEELASGRLSFAHPAEVTYEWADFVFLCLPTPPGPTGAADLSAVRTAVALAGPRLRPGAVVVNKSTVPVGTTRQIAQLIGRDDVAVVSNPEFLQEGAAISAFLDAERVLVGADDPEAARQVASLYASTSRRVHLTSVESAELAKYACNAFLATKLSFVNAMAGLCDRMGADIGEVTAVMGSDSRIGQEFLRPGPGWGGSCFPKDVRALIASAADKGVDLELLRAVFAANEQAFDQVVAVTAAACGGNLEGRRVAAWGITFKAGTDDVRESPAVAVISRLQAGGASVVAYDPAARSLPGITTAPDLYAASEGAEVVVVLTEWPQFATSDLVRVATIMKNPVLVDTRGIVDPDLARRAGITYRAIGYPPRTRRPFMPAIAGN